MSTKQIEMKKVESSQIEAIGHSDTTLAIQFKPRGSAPGSVYHYANFDDKAFEEFRKAPSIGSYFHQKIRGVYSFNRIS